MAVVLAVIFRVQYGRPIARSLGWRPFRTPAITVVGAGIATAFLVNFIGALLHTPTTMTPMMELLQDRPSLIVLTLFGVTIAPAVEELGFRGFLQPLLARSLPAWAAIVISAAPFGFLHLRQYGGHWQFAAMVALAGVAFGIMRHVTGSSMASALMHAAFNGVTFAALWATRHGR
jgi:membrane protease YdiL (CAAX protease family)